VIYKESRRPEGYLYANESQYICRIVRDVKAKHRRKLEVQNTFCDHVVSLTINNGIKPDITKWRKPDWVMVTHKEEEGGEAWLAACVAGSNASKSAPGDLEIMMLVVGDSQSSYHMAPT
jgi:hypothetical protein